MSLFAEPVTRVRQLLYQLALVHADRTLTSKMADFSSRMDATSEPFTSTCAITPRSAVVAIEPTTLTNSQDKVPLPTAMPCANPSIAMTQKGGMGAAGQIKDDLIDRKSDRQPDRRRRPPVRLCLLCCAIDVFATGTRSRWRNLPTDVQAGDPTLV